MKVAHSTLCVWMCAVAKEEVGVKYAAGADGRVTAHLSLPSQHIADTLFKLSNGILYFCVEQRF